MKRKRQPLLTWIVLLMVTGGALLFYGKTTVLELVNLDHKHVLLMRVSPSERFSMFYVHSIYDAYVVEEFEAGRDAIILKGVRTENPKVMEYYGFDSVIGFHPLNLQFREPLIIKRGISQDQGFIIKGKKVHLREFAEKGDRVQMGLKTASWGAYFLAKLSGAPLAPPTRASWSEQ
ncbi:MAG: hypothetical protein AB1427_01875 [Thermodesulfobacteriota bacterium]